MTNDLAALSDAATQTGQDVLVVRAILHAHQRAMTPPDSGWGDMSYEKGSYDHLPTFQAALAAYRAGHLAVIGPDAVERVIQAIVLKRRDWGDHDNSPGYNRAIATAAIAALTGRV
jgi:hypothetical protein